MSQAGSIGGGGGGGGGIITIDGNTGYATGSTIAIIDTQGTGKFTGNDVSTITHTYTSTDGLINTVLGAGTNSANFSGPGNVGFGDLVFGNLTSGQRNVAMGAACLLNAETGSYNTALGYENLFFANGSYNVSVGYISGVAYEGTESSNILIHNIGIANDNNTIRIGTQGTGNAQQNKCFIAGIAGATSSNAFLSMVDSVTGQLTQGSLTGNSGAISGNALVVKAVDGSALFTGSSSTMSLTFTSKDGLFNTILGNDTNFANITGPTNCGFGYLVLGDLTSGERNCAFGAGSISQATSGSYNTCYGYETMFFGNGSYNIVFGDIAGINYTGTESSNIIISNAGVTSENNVIRIGTQGTGNSEQNTCYIAGITGSTVTGTAVLCSSTGQLGTIASSIRYKENVEDISDNVSIMKLRPVQFNYKESGLLCYGLIAEEVEKDFPYLCFHNSHGEAESVNYHELPTLLLMEIQRLNQRLELLESRLVG